MRKRLGFVALLLWALTSDAAHAEEPPRLELEAGAGISTEAASPPYVTARGAVDLWNLFSVGVRGVGVLGHRATSVDPNQPGYQAWAALPELRFHLNTQVVQPFVEGGVGIGKLMNERGGDPEVTLMHGRLGLYYQFGLGARALAGPVTVTLEALVGIFTRVSGGNGAFLQPPTPAEEAREKTLPVGMLQLSIGWRGAL